MKTESTNGKRKRETASTDVLSDSSEKKQKVCEFSTGVDVLTAGDKNAVFLAEAILREMMEDLQQKRLEEKKNGNSNGGSKLLSIDDVMKACKETLEYTTCRDENSVINEKHCEMYLKKTEAFLREFIEKYITEIATDPINISVTSSPFDNSSVLCCGKHLLSFRDGEVGLDHEFEQWDIGATGKYVPKKGSAMEELLNKAVSAVNDGTLALKEWTKAFISAAMNEIHPTVQDRNQWEYGIFIQCHELAECIRDDIRDDDTKDWYAILETAVNDMISGFYDEWKKRKL